MITLDGVGGAKYAVRRTNPGDYVPTLPVGLIFLPECIIEDYGTKLEYHKAIKPALDALWNAAGFAFDDYYDETGLWVGGSRR